MSGARGDRFFAGGRLDFGSREHPVHSACQPQKRDHILVEQVQSICPWFRQIQATQEGGFDVLLLRLHATLRFRRVQSGYSIALRGAPMSQSAVGISWSSALRPRPAEIPPGVRFPDLPALAASRNRRSERRLMFKQNVLVMRIEARTFPLEQRGSFPARKVLEIETDKGISKSGIHAQQRGARTAHPG